MSRIVTTSSFLQEQSFVGLSGDDFMKEFFVSVDTPYREGPTTRTRPRRPRWRERSVCGRPPRRLRAGSLFSLVPLLRDLFLYVKGTTLFYKVIP